MMKIMNQKKESCRASIFIINYTVLYEVYKLWIREQIKDKMKKMSLKILKNVLVTILIFSSSMW